jgi:hypothetical protein
MGAPLGSVSDRTPAIFPRLRLTTSWPGLALIVVVVLIAALSRS